MLIFLAESDQNLRLGMQMLLHQEAGMHVIGMAVEAEGLLVQLEASRAELLILDWQLPGADMPALINDIGGLVSPPKIVVLAVDPEVKALALSAGADAFVGKNTSPDELLKVVRKLQETVKSSA